MNDLKLSRKLTFLYTNIGRGHPFYLDGITEALIRKGQIKLVRNEVDVFELSSGLSKLSWKLVRFLYKKGSQEGIVSRIYKKLRHNNNYNGGSLLQNILGSKIVKKFEGSNDPVLVAHPLLASMLQGRVELFYQHGEAITPDESIVSGVDRVFVPTKDAAQPFLNDGYNSEQVIVTGLCIEPALVRQAVDCYEMRIKRICGQEPLCGAFFSSGAEPKGHLRQIIDSARSALSDGQRVIIFARGNGNLASMVVDAFEEMKHPLSIIDSKELIPRDMPPASLVIFSSRREENSLTAKLFSEFDYLVSPAHERTNWALGLGLPMFILTPNIGPFAPLNAQLMLEKGVAYTLSSNELRRFGKFVTNLRKNGELPHMANLGWGQKIDGFDFIADYLDTHLLS